MAKGSHGPVEVESAVTEALDAFGDAATSSGDRRTALTFLIERKALPRMADDPRVRQGRDLLLEGAREPNGIGQLLSIAEVVRLSQVVKKWGEHSMRQLAPAFVSELPAISLLNEASDRLNVVRACSAFRAPWLATYLATAIAEEEAGEKARLEALRGLERQSRTVADLVRNVLGAFEKCRPTTESPGDTLARRLTRTLASFRVVVLDTELEPGDSFGSVFRRLLADPFHERPIHTESARVELASEALLALHDVLRTQVSLILDPASYEAVALCRRMCGGGSWPRELEPATERLVVDVKRALVFLGSQGKRDQTMLEQLKVLTNFPERAQAIAKSLAEGHDDLPEEVREWLLSGRIRPQRLASASATEASAGSADEAIGLALQDARQLRRLVQTLTEPLISNLELLDPALASACRNLLTQAERAVIQIEQVSELRGILLFGEPGDQIEAAPKYFEVLGDRPLLRMTVRQPAVVRRAREGLGEVILKGIVE